MIIGAVMVPHPPIAVSEIGKGEEKKIQPTLDSFHAMARFVKQLRPETILLITPHSICYRDWFNVSDGARAYGDFSNYRAPSVQFEVRYDQDFTDRLTDFCEREGFPAGTQYDREKYLDQGTMVPLYFLNQEYTDYKLVRLSFSGMSLAEHYRYGMMLQKLCEGNDRRYLIMASGDLSHCQKEDGPYGFREEGVLYDERIMKTMSTGNFLELLEYDSVFLEKAEECGHRSFTVMAGALDAMAVRPKPLTHEATLGVGYGFVLYEIAGRDHSRNFLDQYETKLRESIRSRSQDPWVALARKTIETWIRERRITSIPSNCPKELLEKQAGVFVSIHENGMLRGCIGTIMPVQMCVAEEIVHNAISACSRDPRFDPVRVEELPYLEISVDVLSEPEVCEKDQLDVKRYGVICSTADGKRGLLLPDLDGVDSVDQQIAIACSKGGIDPEIDHVILERFEVIRHA